jgi:hypothetical protein
MHLETSAFVVPACQLACCLSIVLDLMAMSCAWNAAPHREIGFDCYTVVVLADKLPASLPCLICVLVCAFTRDNLYRRNHPIDTKVIVFFTCTLRTHALS